MFVFAVDVVVDLSLEGARSSLYGNIIIRKSEAVERDGERVDHVVGARLTLDASVAQSQRFGVVFLKGRSEYRGPNLER